MPASTTPNTSQSPTIDTLLRLVPDSPSTVLTYLTSHPSLAHAADTNGYTLAHASASYAQLSLLRTIIQQYGVDPNIRDADGETPLFAAETVEVARVLVEELGADPVAANGEGVSVLENARECVEDGGEWVGVVEYLSRRVEGLQEGSTQNAEGQANGHAQAVASTSTPNGAVTEEAEANGHAPPPLPPGVRITGMRTVPESEQEGGEAPDPEFRRRIEELAAREDFQTEEGQAQLKALVEDAVGGLRSEGEEREVRRRVE